ncbi:MAG: ARMT1-like domain-containing protein [Acidaminobacteraceae bacterium]
MEVIISGASFEETAPFLAMKVHKFVKEATANEDPYKELKHEYNSVARELVDEMKLEETIRISEFPFDTACRLSIAGNIIDFGLGLELDKSSVQKSINQSMKAEIFGESTKDLYQKLLVAKNIMIITDNAGEIVFDKLLVNELDKEKITYVVKGGPIVNDATMEDAREVGMTKLVKVIDNGAESQGTILSICSDEFNKAFENADIILSKGQANYETLSDLADSRIHFLLRAKCQSIANNLKCHRGDFVIKNFDLSS